MSCQDDSHEELHSLYIVMMIMMTMVMIIFMMGMDRLLAWFTAQPISLFSSRAQQSTTMTTSRRTDQDSN
jgi:hypothetical protein